MAKPRRPPSKAELEQRRAQERELVRASVEQLRTSAGWQAWLRTRARFPTYSWRNALLIQLQHPAAQRVAGFRAWLDLGYCVRRRPDDVAAGEWAIRIWARCAPSQKRLREWREAGGDADHQPKPSYRLVCVYAQDQVEPLPPPAQPAALTAPIAEITGDSHAAAFVAIAELAATIGYRVGLGDTGRADGTCNHNTRQLSIAERLSSNGRVVAGIHELAHALVRIDEAAPALTYAQEELVVESIAFTCSRTMGLDSSANSIPYLTSWAESASLDVLEHTAGLIGRLADRIEAALLPRPAAAPDPTAPERAARHR